MPNINININDFDYALPDERIAKYPLQQRDMSKLLIFDNQNIVTDTFKNISNYLPNDGLLIFNDTKVINARLLFEKETGAKIEIFCLHPIDPVDFAISFASTAKCSWNCFVGNSKKWKEGRLKKTFSIAVGDSVEVVDFYATRIKEIGNSFEVLFEWNNANITFSQIIDQIGNIPIPPYLNRQSESIDRERYQTVYSHYKGSVAAPTAGLHFTDAVIDNLKKLGTTIETVTLHVGAGTFQPVKTDMVSEHEMHVEQFVVNRTTIENIIKFLGNITITGTTSVRTVESLFRVGVAVLNNPSLSTNEFTVSQWESYDENQDLEVGMVLKNLLAWMDKNGFDHVMCNTQIMIIPGFKFKITDRLITNFHQPKSTLLLLLSAFIGDNWKRVYSYALDNDYRFLSYGDSSLFYKPSKK